MRLPARLRARSNKTLVGWGMNLALAMFVIVFSVSFLVDEDVLPYWYVYVGLGLGLAVLVFAWMTSRELRQRQDGGSRHSDESEEEVGRSSNSS